MRTHLGLKRLDRRQWTSEGITCCRVFVVRSRFSPLQRQLPNKSAPNRSVTLKRATASELTRRVCATARVSIDLGRSLEKRKMESLPLTQKKIG